MDAAFLQAIGTCRNVRFCPEFAEIIRKLFVPMVALWTGLLTGCTYLLSFTFCIILKQNGCVKTTTGDLGRHGKGPVYDAFHNNYVEVRDQIVQVKSYRSQKKLPKVI